MYSGCIIVVIYPYLYTKVTQSTLRHLGELWVITMMITSPVNPQSTGVHLSVHWGAWLNDCLMVPLAPRPDGLGPCGETTHRYTIVIIIIGLKPRFSFGAKYLNTLIYVSLPGAPPEPLLFPPAHDPFSHGTWFASTVRDYDLIIF